MWRRISADTRWRRPDDSPTSSGRAVGMDARTVATNATADASTTTSRIVERLCMMRLLNRP
jgi:hypothetical protein